MAERLKDLHKEREQRAIAHLDEARAEVERLKADYERACATIAEMHAAVSGRMGDGPRRGVVEDVQDLAASEARLAEALVAWKVWVSFFARDIGTDRQRKTWDAVTPVIQGMEAALAARPKATPRRPIGIPGIFCARCDGSGVVQHEGGSDTCPCREEA